MPKKQRSGKTKKKESKDGVRAAALGRAPANGVFECLCSGRGCVCVVLIGRWLQGGPGQAEQGVGD